MLQQCHQRRRRYPRDPRGGAERCRPRKHKLVADLARQAADPGIIEIGREQQRLIVTERDDVLLLALEVTRVTGVDFELLGDLGGQCSELWPDMYESGDINFRI